MKKKVSELIGSELDWAVAQSQGLNYQYPEIGPSCPEYSTDWTLGGPIIEQEKIRTYHMKHWPKNPEHVKYRVRIYWDTHERVMNGPTQLIATMRCLVASKLGDEVDIPNRVVGKL